jgi:hypothetical protein
MKMWDSYPEDSLPDATEAFYWILTSIEDRPMLVLGAALSLVDRVWVDGYSGLSSAKHSLGEQMLGRSLVEQVERREVCISD